MVDQLLGGLFGGQDTDDDNIRRSRARDFVSRYEQGPADQGYDDDEVYQNYRAAESRLPQDQYEDAAAEAFERMSPQERGELGRMMNERSGGRVQVESDDPRDLARTASRFRQDDSSGGGLADLLGFGGGSSGGGGLLDAKRGDGGGGGMLNSPIAKAALAGVAAMAMKKMF